MKPTTDIMTIGNAYVSGMKEDLHLTGNRLNYINAACAMPSSPF